MQYFRLVYPSAINLRLVRLKGFKLGAAWTKNRKPGFQPLPSTLVEALKARANGKALTHSLLYVGTNPSRCMEADFKKAGIRKVIVGEGKLDFHSSRTAYTTLLFESGATVKEAQELLTPLKFEAHNGDLRAREERTPLACRGKSRHGFASNRHRYGASLNQNWAPVGSQRESDEDSSSVTDENEERCSALNLVEQTMLGSSCTLFSGPASMATYLTSRVGAAKYS